MSNHPPDVSLAVYLKINEKSNPIPSPSPSFPPTLSQAKYINVMSSAPPYHHPPCLCSQGRRNLSSIPQRRKKTKFQVQRPCARWYSRRRSVDLLFRMRRLSVAGGGFCGSCWVEEQTRCETTATLALSGIEL